MGATSEMYPSPWREIEDARFLDWPTYQGEPELCDVALRVIEAHGIVSEDVVVGSSLGGMVALEIAHLVGCERIVLIGSAQRACEINGPLRAAAPFAELAPLRLTQLLAGVCSGRVGGMFRDADPAFIRSMLRALGHWQARKGCPGHPRESTVRETWSFPVRPTQRESKAQATSWPTPIRSPARMP